MNIIKRIVEWNKERQLDKLGFNKKNETTLLLEELLEMHGYEVTKDKRNQLYQLFQEFMWNAEEKGVLRKQINIDADYEIDALCDIVVVAVGSILKKGYNPGCAMDETLKEIESRVGKIIDGKFVKDTSEKAKRNWYKAFYEKCKL